MGCLLTKTSHWGKFYKYEQMVKKIYYPRQRKSV